MVWKRREEAMRSRYSLVRVNRERTTLTLGRGVESSSDLKPPMKKNERLGWNKVRTRRRASWLGLPGSVQRCHPQSAQYHKCGSPSQGQ